MIIRWLNTVRVFLIWLLGLGLTFVILALFHELLMVFVVNTLHYEKYVVRFLNMLYYFPAGIVCIAYFVFLYSYLDRSTKKGLLLKNSMRVIGYQLLLVPLIQLGLLGYRFLPFNVMNISLILGEILAAAVLITLSVRIKYIQ